MTDPIESVAEEMSEMQTGEPLPGQPTGASLAGESGGGHEQPGSPTCTQIPTPGVFAQQPPRPSSA